MQRHDPNLSTFDWFVEMGIPRDEAKAYAKTLAAHGFDTLRSLGHINQIELRRFVTKAGHQRVLHNALGKLFAAEPELITAEAPPALAKPAKAAARIRDCSLHDALAELALRVVSSGPARRDPDWVKVKSLLLQLGVDVPRRRRRSSPQRQNNDGAALAAVAAGKMLRRSRRSRSRSPSSRSRNGTGSRRHSSSSGDTPGRDRANSGASRDSGNSSASKEKLSEGPPASQKNRVAINAWYYEEDQKLTAEEVEIRMQGGAGERAQPPKENPRPAQQTRPSIAFEASAEQRPPPRRPAQPTDTVALFPLQDEGQPRISPRKAAAAATGVANGMIKVVNSKLKLRAWARKAKAKTRAREKYQPKEERESSTIAALRKRESDDLAGSAPTHHHHHSQHHAQSQGAGSGRQWE